MLLSAVAAVGSRPRGREAPSGDSAERPDGFAAMLLPSERLPATALPPAARFVLRTRAGPSAAGRARGDADADADVDVAADVDADRTPGGDTAAATGVAGSDGAERGA